MKSINILRAIANQKRLETVYWLYKKKELKVSDIGKFIGLSQSATSQHLAVLRKAGVVKTRNDRQMIFYSLDDNLTKEILKLVFSYS